MRIRVVKPPLNPWVQLAERYGESFYCGPDHGSPQTFSIKNDSGHKNQRPRRKVSDG